MYTVQPPTEPWGTPPPEPGRYSPSRPNGRRALGWEDIDITLLAKTTGVSFRYLLAVLCGQRNYTLAFLQQTAQALGIELTALITRIERAHALRAQAALSPPDKEERRRERCERQAIENR